MPKWRDRECSTCHEVLLTASRSNVCLTCIANAKKGTRVDRQRQIIEDYDYRIEGELTTNTFGKRVYKLVPSCCGIRWGTVFGNLMSGIKKNEQSGYQQLPCGTCGPKNRMAMALEG